jgi:hypothetical protein
MNLEQLEKTECRLGFNEGWDTMVNEMLETIDAIVEDYGLPQITYRQIKQKFTALRVYYSFGQPSDTIYTEWQREGFALIREVIELYEWFSMRTCTLTGLPGKQVVIGGYYTVLHESLFKENKKHEQCYTDKGKALLQQLRGY